MASALRAACRKGENRFQCAAVSGAALAGIRVLDAGELVSAPYTAKLFADFGADVIKVEPPGAGDAARSWGPFPGDEPHIEKSGLFFFLNTN
ncbi:MAG: hypothetical protein D6815_06825, partial [Candidatus Dadabacteria bacterium]